MRILLLGCGYLGRPLAELWQGRGHLVFPVSRSVEKCQELTQAGFQPVRADLTQAPSLARLPAVDAVIYAIGYQRGSGYSRRDLHVSGLRNLLDAIPTPLGRFVFVSSTGVYGDHAGQLVDETTSCRPDGESGEAILEAERLLMQSVVGPATIVLRLAGIYGPGRIPSPKQVGPTGRPGSDDASIADGVSNLIHRDDAVAAIDLALRLGTPPAIYNVSDGCPVSRAAFRAAARGLPRRPDPGPTGIRQANDSLEPVAPAESEAAPRSLRESVGSKRVCSDRIRRELGFQPRYATYLDGLEALGGAVEEEASRP